MIVEEYYIQALEKADTTNNLLLAILLLLGIIFIYKYLKDTMRG